MVLNLMIDLETWGTEPGCDIRSIGATVFNPPTGDVSIPCQYCQNGQLTGLPGNACENCMNTGMTDGYGSTFYIACDNPQTERFGRFHTIHGKYPLTRDPRTVQWWSEQSDEAQAAFANPVDLREALERFNNWYYSLACAEPHKVRLWSHGPAFDPPILAAAYKAVGLPVPWHYRAPRDTRTIFDLAGIDDHSAWLAAHPGPLGVPHHAADDAICQARAVCAAYEIIGTWRNAHEEYERDL